MAAKFNDNSVVVDLTLKKAGYAMPAPPQSLHHSAADHLPDLVQLARTAAKRDW